MEFSDGGFHFNLEKTIVAGDEHAKYRRNDT